MACTHKSGRWESKKTLNWDGEYEQESVYVEYSLLKDVDLHRMKCSLCGKIDYYSGAARSYYEEGIVSDIPGLNATW